MKIIVVYTFSLLFFNLSLAQSPDNKIQQTFDLFAGAEGMENAAISFMAYDLNNKKLLGNSNSKMAIAPASVVKLFTTAAALEILGPNHQPTTNIYVDGAIDSLGNLNGSVYIKGGGDPSLGSRFFFERENQSDFLNDWIKAIKEIGIKKITGKIIADGSDFGYDGAPDGWSWSDLGNYYGAGPSGCVIYDNMTYLHFSTSSRLDDVTTLDSMTPKIEGYSLFNRVTTYNARGDNAYIYGSPYSYDRFAIGNLPRNKSNFEVKASIPDPELLMAQEFKRALEKDGIPVEKDAVGVRSLLLNGEEKVSYSDKKLILKYSGKSIIDVIHWTNFRSVNLFAEQLLCLIGEKQNGLGTTSNSAKSINEFWEPRLNLKMYQTDGSGLSRSNGFSANHFIQLLDYMYQSENYETYKNTIPVAGQSGTLRGICRGQSADGRMYAKSGTMNRIKSYSGYVNSKSGNTIAFALIVNNDNLPNYLLIRNMEKVFNAMAEY